MSERSRSGTSITGSAERAMRIVASLEVYIGGATPRLISLLGGNTVRIGRADGNEVVVPDPQVSRVHALVSATPEGVYLSDLGSKNGVMIDGERLDQARLLRDGERFFVGSAQFLFKWLKQSESGEDSSIIETQSSGLKHVGATVLVCDLASFTRMSEVLPGVEIAEFLQRWIMTIQGVVEAYGGEIDKLLGDGALAIWPSASGAEEQGARSALMAARSLLTETRLLAKDWKYAEQLPWACRVVMNSGSAIIGTFGEAGSREITMLGDTVNVVFRMTKACKQFNKNLLLTAATAALLADQSVLVREGAVEVEGREQGVVVYSVSGV